eukprot:TRINITY_DN13757_c0_g1_i6.p1 TRINITY_DN13757_c0_g1~~TRINITY_DN13757_c0_g1_i6.p1  ORF type:complete len:625 (-),score=209.73 TRINITY_DN13757_c0_g1_i6:814-2688(-)
MCIRDSRGSVEGRLDKISDSVGDKFDKFSNSMGDRFDKLSSRFSKSGEKKEFQLTPDSVTVILYTSGTTGHSKGVVLTHRNLVANALGGVETIPVFKTDRFLSVLPMSHTYECTVGLIVPVLSGSAVYYLQKPPTPRTLLPAMQEVKPTVMNVVPLIIEKIFKKRIKPKLAAKGVMGAVLRLGPARRKVSRIAGRKLMEAFGGEVRCLCIGGAPISPEVESFLADSGVPYAIGYGMTEASPLLAGVGQDRQRFRAIGPPIPGVELRIDDPDPETGEGEILARGPNIMLEYYKAPRDTSLTFTPDGWLKTGDLGKFDADGYLYIKGRLKNVIIGPSGENIYPEEIESIINEHEFVMESLVYESEGKVCARIHLNYDALDEAFGVNGKIESEVRIKVQAVLEMVRKEVNGKVSSFARVARVREQVEPFDKTPTHKIKRFVYLEKQFGIKPEKRRVSPGGAPQAADKPPSASLLQKAQTLTYAYIRFGLELFSRLAADDFSAACQSGLCNQSEARLFFVLSAAYFFSSAAICILMILSGGADTWPLLPWPRLMLSTNCMPLMTVPQTVYLPSRYGAGAKQIKNWLSALSGAWERAMPQVPRLNGMLLNSAGMFVPEPPLPVPSGSPP